MTNSWRYCSFWLVRIGRNRMINRILSSTTELIKSVSHLGTALLCRWICNYFQTSTCSETWRPLLEWRPSTASLLTTATLRGELKKISVACRLLLQPFVNRYVPSQADTQVYEALGSAPKDAHALRWFVEFDIINLKLLESKSTKHR